MFLDKLFGAGTLDLDFLSWLLLAAIVILLTAVVFLLPKGEKTKKIIAISLFGASVATFITHALVNKEGNGFSAYLLLVIAIVLGYGLLFSKSNLAQALYGVTVSIALPVGLVRLLFPVWAMGAESVTDIFASKHIVTLLVYALIYIVAVWLVISGTYRLNLSSLWHIFYGFVVFGSVMLFLEQANFTQSHIAQRVMGIFGANGINVGNATQIALICGLGILIILAVSMGATLWRIYVQKSGEKLIASETTPALLLRLAGKVVSIVLSGLLLVFLPSWLGATNDSLGMPMAFLFLAPLVVMAVTMLIFEFLAEDHEIKVAQARFGK